MTGHAHDLVQGTPTHLPAEVLVKRRKRLRGGAESWEVVRARGHLDEVLELRASTAPPQGVYGPRPLLGNIRLIPLPVRAQHDFLPLERG